MLKKVVVFLLMGVLLFVPDIKLGAKEFITLRISWWGSQARHDKTLAAIELFEKMYPEVKIQSIYTGWREYWDRMATYAAGGDLPDIMQHDYKYFTYYNQYNLLMEMDSFIGDVIKINDVNEYLLNSAQFNGKLYGIPAGLNTYTILYDPDKFIEAGLEEPSYDWTWEEYLDICRELNSSLGIYAATSLPMATRNITGLEHYVRQHGQSLFANNNYQELGFSEDLFVDFYKMDLELTREGVFAPGELRIENNTIENDLIVSDDAVMAAYWTNQIVAIAEAAEKPLKMVPFPSSRDQVQSGYYLKPSMYWTITKNSRHPEMAAKFIDFLINDVEVNEILNGDRGVPISPVVRREMEPILDETERKMFNFIRFISLDSGIIDPPLSAQYDQMIDILEEEHYKILNGSQTPHEAYQQLKKRIKTISLSEFKR